MLLVIRTGCQKQNSLKYPNNTPYLSAMPLYWKIDFMEIHFIGNFLYKYRALTDCATGTSIGNFLEDLSNMKDSTY